MKLVAGVKSGGTAEMAERGIEVCDTPRGGKVTYHGPGQLVMYPLIDLRGIGEQPGETDRIDVAGFVASLEAAMSAALAGLNIDSAAIDGLTGLWVSHGTQIPADATAASKNVSTAWRSGAATAMWLSRKPSPLVCAPSQKVGIGGTP